MLILKLSASQDPGGSTKVVKRRVDNAALVFYPIADNSRLRDLLNQCKEESYIDLLLDAAGNIERHFLLYPDLNKSAYSKIRKRTPDTIFN